MFNDVCIVSKASKIVYQVPHKMVCQHGDCMATLIFLMGLCGYVLLRILILSPSRVAFANRSTVNAVF